ncbi:MAG: hypothetical protein GF421_13090 [Candidatus Aminicenantes bacterium]|nr:hypothetical protein [Candidatus Aminicenantes bacterium]
MFERQSVFCILDPEIIQARLNYMLNLSPKSDILSADILERRYSSLESYKGLDSKYKFILLVSKRARQLLKGAKPKIKSKSKSLIQIAQEEMKKGLVDFNVMDEGASEKGKKQKDEG